jgi:hypothetical protein
MWMWLLVETSIYHTFTKSLLENIIFWNENFQISHMVSKWFILCDMTWLNIPSTFIKIKLFLEYIYFIEYKSSLHSFSQIYSNFSFYKMKWNNFLKKILFMLYSNIICKNIVKIFQKFEVGYIQTCTSMKSSTMWHLKGGHCNVFSPMK